MVETVKLNLVAVLLVSHAMINLADVHISAPRVVDSTTIDGKVLFGYQGWFGTPNDGAERGWVHWSAGVSPDPNHSTFDLWPDMSEYSYSTPTPKLTSRKNKGSPMSLFSDFPSSTQAVHFKWMQEYGIDGVFLQRFVNELEKGPCSAGNIAACQKNNVTLSVMRAAEAAGRTFALMYDISGSSESKWIQTIMTDWQFLTEELKITGSSSYLHQDRKPVLAVWGIGFGPGNAWPGNPITCLNFIQSLKKLPVFYVGGTPTHWREGKGDSKPGYDAVYAAMDIVSPWLVGRFANEVEFDAYYVSTFVADKVKTDSLGIGYAKVVLPGFSWSNMQRARGSSPSKFNQIPRNAGKFWRHQANRFVNLKPRFIYGAMFDECDEGTAILKAASTLDDTPAEGQYLYYSIDGVRLPSDYYLQVAGNFTAQWQSGAIDVFQHIPRMLKAKTQLDKKKAMQTAAQMNLMKEDLIKWKSSFT